MDLEAYLAKRLSESVDHDATHGVYLKDGDRHELMRLLGRNFNTTAELMDVMRRAVTLSIEAEGGHSAVVVEQTLLMRAKSRAEVERVSVAEWLRREAIMGLERTCGLR